MSSPAAGPYRTGSARLALTALFTRSSHTPSQFHSAGRRFLPSATPSLEVVEVGLRGCWAGNTEPRYARHAWYAPGLAAASSDTESRTASSLKVDRMYSSMVTMDTPVAEVCTPGLLEVVSSATERTGAIVEAGLCMADSLTSREVATDRRARPNQ